MPHQVDSLVLDEKSSDPGSPSEGEVWFNTTDHRAKLYANSATKTLIDSTDLSDHTGNTSNPHQVTLEQARTQNNQLAGNIDMNNAGTIINVPDPTNDGDVANKSWTNGQIQSYLRGLDWQESVLDRYDPTGGLPGSPSTGDRYISTATANGWTDTYIYEWNGASWVETVPNEGYATLVEDENILYIFDGAAWGQFGSAIDHGSLIGLLDDDHTQYLLVSGTRAMSGDLDMGGNAITNVGNVDGVDVSAHASRHNPGGADALATGAASGLNANSTNTEGTAAAFARQDHTHALDVTNGTISTVEAGDTSQEGTGTGFSRRDHQHAVSTGTPVEITDTTEAEGSATSLARSDHQHGHGDRGGGSLHALTSTSGHGFAPQSNLAASTNPTVNDDGTGGYVVGSRWINTSTDEEFVCLDNSTGAAVWTSTTASAGGGYLVHKAGRVLAASFAGTPKTASVTFSGAMSDTNYAVLLTARTDGTRSYNPNVTTKTTAGFTIDLGSNVTTGLVEVGWIAMRDGESS